MLCKDTIFYSNTKTFIYFFSIIGAKKWSIHYNFL